MAAYTQQDLDNVRLAIMKLATGAMRVSVQFSSGSGQRSTTYKSANMDELRALEQSIVDALTTKPSSRTVLTRSRKGL